MFAVCCQAPDGSQRAGVPPVAERRVLLKKNTLNDGEIIDSRSVLRGFRNPLVFSPRTQPTGGASASASRFGFSPRAAPPTSPAVGSPQANGTLMGYPSPAGGGEVSSRAQTHDRSQVGTVYLPVPTDAGAAGGSPSAPTGEYETVFTTPPTPLYLHKLALTPRDIPLSSQYIRSPAGSMTARSPRTADAEALRAGLKQYEDLRRSERQQAEELRQGRLRAQQQIRDRALQAREHRLRQLAEYDSQRRALRAEAERQQQEKLQQLRRAREEAAKAQAEKAALLRAPPPPAAVTEDPWVSPRAAQPLVESARQSAVLLPGYLNQQSSTLSAGGAETHTAESEAQPARIDSIRTPSAQGEASGESQTLVHQESAVLQSQAASSSPAPVEPPTPATLTVPTETGSEAVEAASDENDITSPRVSSNARPSGFKKSRDRRAAGAELNKALQKQEFKRMETRRTSAASDKQNDDEANASTSEEEGNWWTTSPARAWLVARKMPPAPTADQQKSIDDFAVSPAEVTMLNPDGSRSECELSMSLDALNLAPRSGKEVNIAWKNLRLVFMWDAASKTTKLLSYLRSKTFTAMREAERPFFLLVEYVDEKQFMKRLPLIFQSRAVCYAANLALAAVRDFNSQTRK